MRTLNEKEVEELEEALANRANFVRAKNSEHHTVGRIRVQFLEYRDLVIHIRKNGTLGLNFGSPNSKPIFKNIDILRNDFFNKCTFDEYEHLGSWCGYIEMPGDLVLFVPKNDGKCFLTKPMEPPVEATANTSCSDGEMSTAELLDKLEQAYEQVCEKAIDQLKTEMEVEPMEIVWQIAGENDLEIEYDLLKPETKRLASLEKHLRISLNILSDLKEEEQS